MNEFKTPKGTSLPFLNLKGKQYLMVSHRIVWAREEHPDWTFETEIVKSSEEFTTMKATIKNEQGRIIATAHKTEHKAHFMDHMEKSETSAIGRALALCGYGTQFAQELEETDRIVDSPLAPKRNVFKHGYIMPFGEHKGKPIEEVPLAELISSAEKIEAKFKGQSLPPDAERFLNEVSKRGQN